MKKNEFCWFGDVTLEGFVSKIEGDIAYITVKINDSNCLHTNIKTKKLNDAGIEEGQRFILTPYLDPKNMVAIPFNQLTIEDYEKINKKLEFLKDEPQKEVD